ncbi:hypothetical protein SMC26_09790 [Actinomadura fulvescens]|uniref:Exo-alpha-sialidase n=1 Tax=Actinomadura fulvescens TaxID=46160 RepID=A0ABN3Q5X5_9ACTN
MTPPRTPDDEAGDDRTRAEHPDPPVGPPPPQWLEGAEASPGQLLPEPPTEVEGDDEADDATRTQVVPQKSQSRSADAERTAFVPAPGAPDDDTSDTPGPSPAPPADVTLTDATMFVQQPPAPQPSAPTPFPYAQDIPPAQPQAPAQRPALEPFPYAQEIPGQTKPQPSEPFPYAQEIPGSQAGPAPGAPPPFPYAQEIPGVPSPAIPAAAPPVIDEPWRTPAAKRRKIGKPVIITAGALAAAAVVAVGGFMVLGGDDGSEGGQDGAVLARTVFPVDPAARTDGRDQKITAVSSQGATTVAVGGETDAQSSRVLFLVSGDGGRTFKPAEVNQGDGGAVPVAVTGSSHGWVAIGTRPGGGAVWTSGDGQSWQRLPDQAAGAFGSNTKVSRVVGTNGGFLAIGTSDAEPAVWLSKDGRSWETRVGDKIGLDVKKGKLTLLTVAASGDSILLEGVHTPDPKKPAARRVAWTSGDGGRAWSPSKIPVPKNNRGLMIGGGPAGFVAVREIADGGKLSGQVYTSKDGKSWTQAGKLEASDYRRTSRLLADDKGYAAIIARGQDLLISRSADGQSWQDAGSLPFQAGRALNDAALAGDLTVLVGQEPGGGDVDPLLNVWDGRGAQIPIDLSKGPGAIRNDHMVVAVGATGSQAVAVGSAAGEAAAWTSQDGRTWKPGRVSGTGLTGPGPQRLIDVTSGKSGWLAVGYDQASPRRPLVATSPDGSAWQAAGSQQFGSAALSAVGSGAGYVVAGAEGDSAAVWFSPDLKNWERGKSAGSDGLEGKPGNTRWIGGITGAASGYVAVGGVRDKSGNVPAVWTSADGKSWSLQKLPKSGGVTEGHLTRVAANGGSLVATGLAATNQGLRYLGYTSSDGGKTWRESPAPTSAPDVTVTSLAATPKGFVATGAKGNQGATEVVSWTSTDGSSWVATSPSGEALTGPGDQQITGQATLKNTLVAVGRSTTPQADQPILWTRPVP